MGPDRAAIEDQVLHIRVIGKMVMHIFPDLVVTPAGKALVDAVPGTIFLRQQAPLGAATRDPEHGFQEKPTVGFLACIDSGMALQEGVNLAPFTFSKGNV